MEAVRWRRMGCARLGCVRAGEGREARMSDQSGLSVVLGAGPLGLAVVRRLAARGGRVRAVSRSGRADLPAGVEAMAADVAVAAEARRACAGAAVVYHCASPPYA